jgi:hypothetical protein
LPRLNWPDPVREHHLVVFVLDNVAVPDILASLIKRHSHARNLAGKSNYHVFVAEFPWLWWQRL